MVNISARIALYPYVLPINVKEKLLALSSKAEDYIVGRCFILEYFAHLYNGMTAARGRTLSTKVMDEFKRWSEKKIGMLKFLKQL